ncbi:thioredoxin family protein [Bacillus sp. J33]|uniref:thioredoxin family protein n=1 Tax=Bacillus sp. J33 TaxID=935836 RepID=UPI0004AE1415|nr:thioredoxin family protein [Bacillus sp. J33]
MLPQVEEVLKEYPQIEAGLVNADKVTEIAGFLMAFTVPVVVLYLDGREVLREARFVPVEKLRKDLKRIYEGIMQEE